MINDKMLLEALHQAGHTGVARVELSEGHDWTGDPAFHIRLGMDAAIPVEELRWVNVQELDRWVHDWVKAHAGDSHFPYVRFYSLSEMEAVSAS